MHVRACDALRAQVRAMSNVNVITDHSSRTLLIQKEGGPRLTVPFFSLRESCPTHFDAGTRQRSKPSFGIPFNVSPSTVRTVDDSIEVAWSDGHNSSYPYEYLERLMQREVWNEHVLWNRETMGYHAPDHVPTFEYARFANDEEEVSKWLQAMHHYGVALLRNGPRTQGTVETVVNRFAYVRKTHYGQTFQMVARPNAEHLAFSSLGLQMHSDLNYREASPGIQLLHCIRADVEGGESTFVDGFAAAQRLRLENPKHYTLLTAVPLTFQLHGPGVLHRHTVPAIVLDPSKKHVIEIHHNERTRLPLLGDNEYTVTSTKYSEKPRVLRPSVDEMYEALAHFDRILHDEKMVIEFKLTPGDVVAFNNRRVLHGRREFRALSTPPPDSSDSEYTRHLEGCYVEFDEYRSALRVRGITP